MSTGLYRRTGILLNILPPYRPSSGKVLNECSNMAALADYVELNDDGEPALGYGDEIYRQLSPTSGGVDDRLVFTVAGSSGKADRESGSFGRSRRVAAPSGTFAPARCWISSRSKDADRSAQQEDGSLATHLLDEKTVCIFPGAVCSLGLPATELRPQDTGPTGNAAAD